MNTFWLAAVITAVITFAGVVLGWLLTNWSNSRREQWHRSAAEAAAREEARQVPKPQVAVSVQVAGSSQVAVSVQVAAETARRTRSD
jgi:D-alanyl-lipoteichoic acid acyltransferase DltB (MBOAT superfamily)